MELNSLYYFVEAAEDLNITRTAKRLHMSQQTLSNHIARIEDYYNVKLFYRHPGLQLTQAGREALRFAEQLRRKESDLKSLLIDVEQSDAGEITFSASSPRYNYYLPDVLKKFSDKFPNVTMDLLDRPSAEAETLAAENRVDFAITVDTDAAKLNLNVRSLYPDPVYFCVSDRLLRRHYGAGIASLKEKSIHGAYVADFSKIPFLTLPPSGRLGRRIDECFREAGYEPRSYLRTEHTTITVPLCNAALAGCFTSHMNLTRWKQRMDDDVNIFPLSCHGKPVFLNLGVVHSRQRYLNHHCRYFLDLLDEQFSSIEAETLTRVTE